MKKPTSLRLLEDAQQNVEASFFDIHERYVEKLIRVSSAILQRHLSSKVDADDIAQESFAIFFDKAQKGEIQWAQEGDLWKLLIGIARKRIEKHNERFLTHKRNLFREQNIPTDPLVSPTQNADLIQFELLDLVDSVFADEKQLMRQVLQLRLAGNSSAEMSQQIGRSERTCRRLIELLKSKIEAEHFLELPRTDPVIQSSIPPRSQFDSIERFTLLRKIGMGSFGKVYLAQLKSDAFPRFFFAVKILRKKWMDDRSVSRLFLQESNFLRKLDHDGLPVYYGSGFLDNGMPFCCMELVPLKWETWNWNDPAEAIESLIRLTKILQWLHQQNLAHGDLTERNIGLHPNRQVKLLDFGFAKHDGQSETADFESTQKSDIACLRKIIADRTSGWGSNPAIKNGWDEFTVWVDQRFNSSPVSLKEILNALDCLGSSFKSNSLLTENQ